MELQLLDIEEINSRLEELPEWEFDEENMVLSSEVELENFHEAADFVHQIAEITEDLDHHPDILLHDYKFVTIYTGTHEPEGITEKDFELIAAIEDLFDEIDEQDAEEDVEDEVEEEENGDKKSDLESDLDNA